MQRLTREEAIEEWRRDSKPELTTQAQYMANWLSWLEYLRSNHEVGPESHEWTLPSEIANT